MVLVVRVSAQTPVSAGMLVMGRSTRLCSVVVGASVLAGLTYSSSPTGRRANLSRAMEEDYRMDDAEEEDVIGLLFAANGSDDDFLCLRRGQARVRAKVELSLWTASSTCPENIETSSSTRVQRKRRRSRD